MSLSDIIVHAFEDRLQFSPTNAPQDVRDAVAEALNLLDAGTLRVAEKAGANWQVNQWLKKAVLLSFRHNPNMMMNGGPQNSGCKFLPVRVRHPDALRARNRQWFHPGRSTRNE